MKEFKTGIDRTRTTSAPGKIKFLLTMLCGEALRELDFIANQVGNTTNAHLKQIKEVLLRYFFPINALNKKKRAMRRAMTKPRDLQFKRFAARLTELNNHLPLLPGSRVAKNMDPEELNNILLTPSPTLGHTNPTYRDGILGRGHSPV